MYFAAQAGGRTFVPHGIRLLVAYPVRRIDLRRQRILLSSVTATAAIDPHGLAAHAWAMVGHACGAPARGCDLAALDPMRLRLSCDHHRQDCDIAKNLEFGHFLLQAADPLR